MTAVDFLDPDVYQKKILPLDPEGNIGIKRGMHTIDVAATSGALMPHFIAVLQDPGRRFGLIELLRTEKNVGKPYTVAERFQGRYVIEAALQETLVRLPFRGLVSTLTKALDVLDDALFDPIENRMLSDFGVITDLVTQPSPGQPYRLRYEYLEGTPIAGSLSIECADVGATSCRFTQITEYQEQGLEVLLAYGTSVIKMHERVFYEMVAQAAARLGAAIVSTTIPEAYYRPA